MSNKIILALDNGSSAFCTFLHPDKLATYYKVPTITQLNYTKKKQYITRIDVNELERIINTEIPPNSNVLVGIERGMINPMRFKASISAARALEATLIVIEKLKLSYVWLDSKEWQKKMLPAGVEKEELKKASLEIGKRKFPHLANQFKKDADSALMAEYLRSIN